MAEIQLVFDRNYRLKEVVALDTNENYRRITFSALKINPRLALSNFEFQPPEEVEIIDKTKESP